MGFEAEWLRARGPFDEAALDPVAVSAIRAWGAALCPTRRPVVVDLGSGTGAAIRRVRRWLAPREIDAYAVERDAALLALGDHCSPAVPVVGDLLEPLHAIGGPPDGSVDLVLAHALADLVPLDRLAARAMALVRPGGLVHVALAYDGVTAFSPCADADLDRRVIEAFHRHMDRPAAHVATYGGSTAGRRVAPALAAVGLEIVSDMPSEWRIEAGVGGESDAVLSRLLRFVVEAVRELGDVALPELARWGLERHAALARGVLSVRVGHRDVLARAPLSVPSEDHALASA